MDSIVIRSTIKKMAMHLAVQRARSLDGENKNCQYRSPTGQACVVGCLISDDVYTPLIENRRVNSLAMSYHINPESVRGVAYKSVLDHFPGVDHNRLLDFLNACQSYHDMTNSGSTELYCDAIAAHVGRPDEELAEHIYQRLAFFAGLYFDLRAN